MERMEPSSTRTMGRSACRGIVGAGEAGSEGSEAGVVVVEVLVGEGPGTLAC